MRRILGYVKDTTGNIEAKYTAPSSEAFTTKTSGFVLNAKHQTCDPSSSVIFTRQ